MGGFVLLLIIFTENAAAERIISAAFVNHFTVRKFFGFPAKEIFP